MTSKEADQLLDRIIKECKSDDFDTLSKLLSKVERLHYIKLARTVVICLTIVAIVILI